jgi:hypothetical protein
MPIETRKIHQYDCVRPFSIHHFGSQVRNPKELAQLRHNFDESNDRQLRQIVLHIATSFLHVFAAQPHRLDVRRSFLQLLDKLGCMQVAAWLANGKEKLHAG